MRTFLSHPRATIESEIAEVHNDVFRGDSVTDLILPTSDVSAFTRYTGEENLDSRRADGFIRC